MTNIPYPPLFERSTKRVFAQAAVVALIGIALVVIVKTFEPLPEPKRPLLNGAPEAIFGGTPADTPVTTSIGTPPDAPGRAGLLFHIADHEKFRYSVYLHAEIKADWNTPGWRSQLGPDGTCAIPLWKKRDGSFSPAGEIKLPGGIEGYVLWPVPLEVVTAPGATPDGSQPGIVKPGFKTGDDLYIEWRPCMYIALWPPVDGRERMTAIPFMNQIDRTTNAPDTVPGIPKAFVPYVTGEVR